MIRHRDALRDAAHDPDDLTDVDVYLPNAAEITAATARIRAGWSPLRERKARGERSAPARVPAYHYDGETMQPREGV